MEKTVVKRFKASGRQEEYDFDFVLLFLVLLPNAVNIVSNVYLKLITSNAVPTNVSM